MNHKNLRFLIVLTLLLSLFLSACAPAATVPVDTTTTEQVTTEQSAAEPTVTEGTAAGDISEDSTTGTQSETETTLDGYEREPDTTADLSNEASEPERQDTPEATEPGTTVPSEPATSKPAPTEPPATTVPSTTAPATKPAATNPPATTVPSTTAPATKPAATTPPATTVPSTTAPATKPAATNPPATTVPPTTVAPTTIPPTTVPPTTVPPTTQPPATNPPTPSSSGFKIHFIDVGQADAALVICDGKTMLIDGGNKADSNLIYSYLQKQGVTHLDYIVATHAHEDHVGGLSGALNYATVGTVFCPVNSYSSKAFQNFVSNVQKQGKSLTNPSVGYSFSLGSATCTVLASNTYSDNPNNTSIVLRIVYGSTSFLFMGDAEREVEQVLLSRGVPLKSTVLKVGHHGSYTSTSYPFLNSVMPAYAVICCGRGNDYGHPHDVTLSRLRDADVTVYRTDLHGDIICTSNGTSVSFSVG